MRSGGRGGTGRHAGFRCRWRKPWGFESLRPHWDRLLLALSSSTAAMRKPCEPTAIDVLRANGVGRSIHAVTRRVLLFMLACGLAVGCGHESKDEHATTPSTPAVTSGVDGRPGEQVEIGSGRSLFLQCVGSGSPTVVLEAGFGADTSVWREVQPEVGRTARTCAYDRAGVRNVAPPGVRDARDEIADLRRLLGRARIDPPYVLVGHSYGGVLARVFAHLRPRRRQGSSSSTRWAAMDDDGGSRSGPSRRRLRSAVSWRQR
jgi:hypothetical protein